ncbi:MAG: methylmalonyl-CoA mutase [Spirobacillus cienkowskii]|jgi:methylmalonyl-CoA mutase C-terminal domain/subunit|uniref:Methylmalonyl-CoA mutase n=1 Tax=Spirobacillus cienkowskii TaxID=495820 RepID=A0A369KUF5_9BACT|nr:MAG: methylmalonyl-CoA mutase [Spirobacillus cienkowskii]
MKTRFSFLARSFHFFLSSENVHSGGHVLGGVSFSKIPRVLIAKCGLDGHDRGAKYIAKALRDAGMEVIYTGVRQSTDDVAQTAIQEDVDIVGLSLLSGAHNTLFPKLIEALKNQGGGDIPVFGGGVIPKSDIPYLKSIGVKAIFTPGTTVEDVIKEIKKILEG